MSEKGTEQATPQRRQKAKDKGDVVRSRELISAVAMLAGVVMLGEAGHGFIERWGEAYIECLRFAAVRDGIGLSLQTVVLRVIAPELKPLGLVMATTFIAALLAGIVQGGGVALYPNALALKFGRLNPGANLSHLFSVRTALRTVKSLLPAAVMVALGWSAVKGLIVLLPAMSLARLPLTFAVMHRLALDAAWLLLAWSGLDYAMERRSWSERLKMSKQEIREELRDAMGNPQIKMRVRQAQMAMRRRRVKADMSRASVVITNPTHYAVALEFSFETMQAPTVLAKGRDLVAAEIREEARWLGIPMIENPPLARSLYRQVEAGQSIPFELYAAVAGILAFLYRQKVEERKRQERYAEAMRSLAGPVSAGPGFVAQDFGVGGGI